METTRLKKFAQEARRKLLSQVTARMDYVLKTDSVALREKAEQIQQLREEIAGRGRQAVIDQVAYTWFNRLVALRFMDANDYGLLGLRIISPKPGFTVPELLDAANAGHTPEELDSVSVGVGARVRDLLLGRVPSKNPQNEAFALLLIAACNHLHSVLPFLFERINHYTELLLPEDLTSEFSIVQDVVTGMGEADCQEVEVIGWLYQFYISERKDEVFASKSKVKKEDIPAATQLFTPRWIVEYMVQNTVGKLWLQNRPHSKLREHMPYFIEPASVTAEDYLHVASVEEITLLDQACGSGHILVYGFELLSKIYEEEGYNPSEIPALIIGKNLYGFEIDARAAQLAGFALMMKARQYQRRVFKKEIVPQILCFEDLALSPEEIKATLVEIGLSPSEALLRDLGHMRQATNFGSLIAPEAVQAEIVAALAAVKAAPRDLLRGPRLDALVPALKALELLGRKYHCVVDNPPYMGGGNMNDTLSAWVKAYYPKSKADLMVCFMERSQLQLLKNGYVAMINLPSWMFLSSFEDYRFEMLKEFQIESLLHLGRGIFGADFGTVAFAFRKTTEGKGFGIYRRLFEEHVQVRSSETIRKLFLNLSYGYYQSSQNDFANVPGSPIGYWLSKRANDIFANSPTLESFYVSGGRCKTHNDKRFVKNAWEIELRKTNERWRFYENGGDARLWFGSHLELVDWSNFATEVYESHGGLTKKIFWQKEGIVWNMITASRVTFRKKPSFSEYSSGAPVLFLREASDPEMMFQTLAYLNSKITYEFLKLLNPTINTSVGIVLKLPFIEPIEKEKVTILTEENIQIAQQEWNSREESINFQRNELLRISSNSNFDLGEAVDHYEQYWKNKFIRIHKNEEELNHLFISSYGLQNELSRTIRYDEITLLRPETKIVNNQLVFDAQEVMAQFVSYAVGCMVGRYSLDKEGLILANQGETLEDYLRIIGKTREEAKFLPDEDNIIPILEDEWFEDDITGRMEEFLRVTFGKENFAKNLAFLEECLGMPIRKYFVKEFYKDHVQRYKKRPIYWLFSSPKGSFQVLVYLHRYTPDTLGHILNRYLREYEEKLRTRREHLDHVQATGSPKDINQAIKEKDKIDKVLLELGAYERDVLYPLAAERIALDLDEGVLVNYNKMGKAVAEVPGLNDAKTKKKVREFDWINVEEIR